MKYLGLLRGVNVGGKAIMKMTDLKEEIECAGFSNVRTYIQSGNVIFESDEKDTEKIVAKLENSVSKKFGINSRIIVKTYEQIKRIVSEVPNEWKKQNDLRCYIAFVREPVTVQDVLSAAELKEGIDSVKAGEGVVYMSTLLSGLSHLT